eukprot:TRINITY_DN22326_c0_g1_i3.p2 TRINITY_DN22326_c0_g1~~TRINITY_DN22326_c0_g1_i3.p2  ORF type:complete len:337 (-),score=65.24 TRINITY_DN22326_c0_g1_i3:119-1129(-)
MATSTPVDSCPPPYQYSAVVAGTVSNGATSLPSDFEGVDEASLNCFDRCKLSMARWACCAKFGRLGLAALGRHRKWLMQVTTVWLLISMVFMICACVGLSSNGTVVKNVPWAKYDFTDLNNGSVSTVYINLQAARVDNPDGSSSTILLSDLEDTVENQPEAFTTAKDCGDATTTAEVNLAFTAMFHPLTILSVYERVNHDHGYHKLEAFLGVFLNPLFVLVSLVSFDKRCYEDIHDLDSPQSSVSASLGVGFVMGMLFCVMNYIAVPVLFLCPSPDLPDKRTSTSLDELEDGEQKELESGSMPDYSSTEDDRQDSKLGNLEHNEKSKSDEEPSGLF